MEERSLQIAATLEEVTKARAFIAEVAGDAGLSDDGIYHCQLSVEEVCTNIVEHGYGLDADGKVIDIVCQLVPHQLIIRIFDDASPFNPLQLPEPNPNMPLWDREGGGWGIYFVRKFMTSIDYRYEKGRNQLILRKRID